MNSRTMTALSDRCAKGMDTMDNKTLERIKRYKTIAIFRGVPEALTLPMAEALYIGGIRLLEITFDQQDPERIPKTCTLIEALVSRFGEKLGIGAGTVLSAEEVRSAAAAGASFMLAPNTDPLVIRAALEVGAEPIPGAFTPTETVVAAQAGASLIKVFPAGMLGPAYIKALAAPLSHVRYLAVGGITAENQQAYLDAGAVGTGVASGLVDTELARKGAFREITERAMQYKLWE